MKCARCRRELKKAMLFNGVPFGPVCIKKMGFNKIHIVKIKSATDAGLQLELFGDGK